jgi:predicted nucleic acid-binding protein
MNRVVLDTNILLRIAEPQHSLHAITLSAVRQLRLTDRQPVVLPQIVYEFWAVATRTLEHNGLGMTAAAAEVMLDDIVRRMPLLRDERGVYDNWRQLLKTYTVTGVPSHDMRIVAAMVRHRIPTLLTSNPRHFVRYTSIEVLTPEDVLSAAGNSPSPRAVPEGG